MEKSIRTTWGFAILGLEVVIFIISNMAALVRAGQTSVGFWLLSCTFVFQSAAVPGLTIFKSPNIAKPCSFDELSKIPTIVAVKESSGDVSKITRMKNRFGERFKLLCGVDTLALEELALGADGWVGGLVDAFPAETVAIYKLMKAGRFKVALEIYRWFLPMLELDIHAKLVQYIKLAATQTGISTEPVRAPRLKL